MDFYSIVLCESSAVSILEDCCKLKVKLEQSSKVILHDYQLQKDCLANPVQLFLLHAINFVPIASPQA